MNNPRKPTLGFTFIELVMTVAVMAVVITIGLPSFQSVIVSTRLSTYTNDMVGALNLARSEAVKRNKNVAIASDAAGWQNGWTVFVDEDGNGSLDYNEEVIRKYDTVGQNISLKIPANLGSSITYQPSGRTTTTNSFYFCSPAKQADFRRVVIFPSRIRTETSADNDNKLPTDPDKKSYTTVCPP
jgi:type IV fimbrial biogenesis protein FimT